MPWGVDCGLPLKMFFGFVFFLINIDPTEANQESGVKADESNFFIWPSFPFYFLILLRLLWDICHVVYRFR